MKKDAILEVKPKVTRTTISLQEEVLTAGKLRAYTDDRDFSNYIAVLIKADLARVASSGQ